MQSLLMRNLLCVLCFINVFLLPINHSLAGEPPRLILPITVDQLRGDLPLRYYDRMGENGFQHLYEKGTVFFDAHHAHANRETIVGHATLTLLRPVWAQIALQETILGDFARDADGGITLYIQHNSPGKAKEPNWLPAPKGPFLVVMRLYWPKAEALDGSWKLPPLKRVQ